MDAESLELEIAKSQLRRFEDELDPVIKDHYEAMDCRDCEKMLSKGIDAFKWLSRAEEALIMADAEGIYPWTKEIEESIALLYERWLVPCKGANEWTERVTQNGYNVENLAEFRECCELVEERVQQNFFYRDSRVAAEECFDKDE